MQRFPTRGMPPHTVQDGREEVSPVLRLARRIREEQGAEKVREFLAAMTPFAAPYELRHIAESFGISYESVERERSVRQEAPNNRQAPQPNAGNMLDQINRIKMLMQLSGMMKNGGDPSALLNLLGGK